MKKISSLLFLALFILIVSSYAQKDTKLNFGAALAAANPSLQESSIHVLVQGTISEIHRVVEQMGGTFRYSSGDIASILIKGKNIPLLAERPFVKRMEADNPFSKPQIMSDTMLSHNRVLAAHAGTAPLSQAYKGDGVVMGIIDTGIDHTHPDFKDSSGKSRIKFLWDQELPDSVPPAPYNYGQEWTGTDIDNGKATAHITTAQDHYGHGTHVGSVATGNGRAMNKYSGVAPNADIVFVGLDLTLTNGIMDAVKYVYAKAALLGKPCVINISVGDYNGSHDGKDLEAQSIKNQIIAQNGRSLVAAVGNAGHIPIHVGYTVTSDTNFTWFSGSAYIAMYSDAANFTNVKFTIGADKVTPYYSFRGNLPFSTISSHLGVLKYDTIFNGGNRICRMISYGSISAGTYCMEYAITPDSSAYMWRLMTTGTGKFDAYTFDVDTAKLADSTIYAPLKKYKQPDLKQNMVSGFQCLNEVITVGNYTNRNQYIDYDTLLQQDATRIPGKLSPSSSHGPTRDGRIKPEITSPGDWTIGAIVTSLKNYNIGVGNKYLMAPGGFHMLGGGSSNASPGVAGVAALYLQMDPGATWLEVKNAITNCARLDTYTGLNLPDNNWGYGKVDAFAMLTGCATSVNDYQHIDSELVILYPNPASKQFTIYNIPPTATSIKLYNVLGKMIMTLPANGTQQIVDPNVPKGIYFCELSDGEKVIATKKIIISE